MPKELLTQNFSPVLVVPSKLQYEASKAFKIALLIQKIHRFAAIRVAWRSAAAVFEIVVAGPQYDPSDSRGAIKIAKLVHGDEVRFSTFPRKSLLWPRVK